MGMFFTAYFKINNFKQVKLVKHWFLKNIIGVTFWGSENLLVVT